MSLIEALHALREQQPVDTSMPIRQADTMQEDKPPPWADPLCIPIIYRELLRRQTTLTPSQDSKEQQTPQPPHPFISCPTSTPSTLPASLFYTYLLPDPAWLDALLASGHSLILLGPSDDLACNRAHPTAQLRGWEATFARSRRGSPLTLLCMDPNGRVAPLDDAVLDRHALLGAPRSLLLQGDASVRCPRTGLRRTLRDAPARNLKPAFHGAELELRYADAADAADDTDMRWLRREQLRAIRHNERLRARMPTRLPTVNANANAAAGGAASAAQGGPGRSAEERSEERARTIVRLEGAETAGVVVPARPWRVALAMPLSFESLREPLWVEQATYLPWLKWARPARGEDGDEDEGEDVWTDVEQGALETAYMVLGRDRCVVGMAAAEENWDWAGTEGDDIVVCTTLSVETQVPGATRNVRTTRNLFFHLRGATVSGE